MKDLVSIIMLSRNRGDLAVESVKTVVAQTYDNWELIFLDDSSNDNTINQIMMLKGRDSRIHVFQTIETKGFGVNRISALTSANGRYVAFLDCGDLWIPTKLERQISYMEQNGYAFTYAKYRCHDKNGTPTIEVGGLDVISYSQMQKCCWLSSITVMYDRSKLHPINIGSLNENNDYALFLLLSRQVECHFLNECIATQHATGHFFNPFALFEKLGWRFEVYKEVESHNLFVAVYLTIRNLFYTLLKKVKYAQKISN